MTLTARQYDVLVCLSRGMTRAEAAAELGIAAETVKRHAVELYRRLEVRNAYHAVSVAFQKGILT